MRKQFVRLRRAALVTIAALSLSGQEPSKPAISRITTLPGEPIPPGDCVSSSAGYLEKTGRTKLTEREIGQAVSDAMKHGYVVTIYPPSKRGIFVNFECPSHGEPNSPKVP